MEATDILPLHNREEFRPWLEINHATARECWIHVKRGRPTDKNTFWYLDAVEEALCFGRIDGQIQSVEGVYVQRFSPRKRDSPWTELNKERVRRLEKLGLMTRQQGGRCYLPWGHETSKLTRNSKQHSSKRVSGRNSANFRPCISVYVPTT